MKARSIGVLLTLLATILPSHIPSAQGMHAPSELDYSGEIGPDGRVFFAIADNLLNAGFERVNLRHAARSWRIQGLTQQVQFTNKDDWSQAGYRPATDRLIEATDEIDGDQSLIAYATVGCEHNNSVCEMLFEINPDNNWNTTHEVRDSTSLETIAVGVHEFGHWIGSRHSADRPASDDEHFPTMHTNTMTMHLFPRTLMPVHAKRTPTGGRTKTGARRERAQLGLVQFKLTTST